MQKVIIVNLNRNAYQLDEDAYTTLREYLSAAETQLAANPDRSEIMADLEQAIAEKCMRFLGPHKNVITLVEIQQVIKEMGPVESAEETGSAGAGAGPAAPKASATSHAPKRLYRIIEDGMLGGVCAGFGAYFDVDPTIVRIVFAILAILTHGAFVLVYFVLMFVIPVATTSEERAAAQGLPFTAQELIDRAKKKYAEFHEKHIVKKSWKWKKKPLMTPVDPLWTPPPLPVSAPPYHVGYRRQMLLGVVLPVVAIIRAALAVAFAIGVVWLLRNRAIGDLRVPPDMPTWVAILILALLYQVAAAPFRVAGLVRAYSPYGYVGAEVWSGLLWLGSVIVFFWLAYQYEPTFRDFILSLPEANRWRVQ